ncbi:MAG: DNA gyrase subunit A, partial [Patescibacteria group bacterium]|nr:DNA gyrase subunit A [Patescibacteria group bacterium]
NIEGVFVRKGLTKITITELPIGYNLASYTKVLDDLEDKKIIRSYTDKSNAKTDKFEFDVAMDSKILKLSDDVVRTKLKLVKTVTENFTVIDENNKVVVYNSPEEVINHYIKLKLHFLELRKDYLIQKTKDDLLILASKYLFIKNVTEGSIIVNNKKKIDIINQLETFDKIIKYNDSFEYLLNMPIYSLTEEKLIELKNKIQDNKKDLELIESKPIEETWSNEIKDIYVN